MQRIIAIAKREFLSFFVSPIAYIVITGYVLLAANFFFKLLVLFNEYIQRIQSMPYKVSMDLPNLNQIVENFFHTLVVILVFSIPLLTMRLIADEKRTGTFELLVTSPLSVTDIVLGKFLGLVSVIFVMTLGVLAFPVLLYMLGDPAPELLPIISGAIGLFICSVAFAAISMGVSSFTENQIVAAISGVVVLLLLYVVQSPSSNMGETAQKFFEYLSPGVQISDLFKGVISLKSLTYFLSLTLLGLFLSQRALEAHRWR